MTTDTTATATTWRPVRGRKKYVWTTLAECNMIWAPHLGLWWLETPRGIGPVRDWWGPWKFQSETEARPVLADWSRKLKRAGWFALVLNADGDYDDEAVVQCLSRLPRSEAIPNYFLIQLDEHQAGLGLATSGKTLRIGGADLMFDAEYFDALLGGPRESVRLIAKRAGAKHNLPSSVPYVLNASSLDTLIEFLLEIRKDVVSKRAWDSVNDLVRKIAGPVDGTTGSDALESQFAVMLRVSRNVSEILHGLIDGASRRPEDLMTFAALLNIMAAGNRIDGFLVTPENGPSYVLDLDAPYPTSTTTH